MNNTQSSSDFMKNFLNETSNSISKGTHGNDILSEAINATTNFKDLDSLVDAMVIDATGGSVSAAGNSTSVANSAALQRLSNNFGIIFDDVDTGSVIGKHTGGNTAYNAEDIVPESGSITGSQIPVASDTTVTKYFTNAQGNRVPINIIWQTDKLYLLDPSDDDADLDENNVTEITELTQEQQNSFNTIAEGLNRWWLSEACTLVDKSFGLSMENATLKIALVSSSTDEELDFSAETSPDDENADIITMYVNLDIFTPINSNNANGDTSANYEPQVYADRVIAHEMTHAAMLYHKLMDCDEESEEIGLPGQYTEGIADFVHGTDDSNANVEEELLELASSYDTMSAAMELTSGTGEENYYTAGYMMMRYLVHQSTGGVKTNFSINDDFTVRNVHDGMVLTESGTRNEDTNGEDVLGSFSVSNSIASYSAISTLAAQNINIGSDSTLILTGTNNDDTINVMNANVTVNGSDGNDSILGSSGNETLTINEASNVYIDAGTGNNMINLNNVDSSSIVVGSTTTLSAESRNMIKGYTSDNILIFADGNKDKSVNFTDNGLTLYTDTIMSPNADYVKVTFNDIKDTALVNLQYGTETSEIVAFINNGDIYNVTTSAAQEYIGAVATPNQGLSFSGVTEDLNLSLEGGNDSLQIWNIHTIIGGDGNTTITGSDSNDTIYVGQGDTTIYASTGIDYIVTNGNHTTYINGDEVTTLYSSTWRTTNGELEDLNGFVYDGDEFNAIMYTGDIILGDGYLRLSKSPRITLSEDTVAGTFAAINNQLYGWSGQAGGIVDITKSGITNSDQIAAQKAIIIGIAPNGPSTLIGGNNDDTIYAGGADTVKLSGGKDFISIDHINRENYEGRDNQDPTTIEFTSGVSSNSTVENYKVGTDIIKVDNINNIKISESGTGLKLKYNGSTLMINNTNTIEINGTIINYGENLSYNDSINYYGSDNSSTLNIDSNYEVDNASIWLNGSDGKIYSNVKDINASNYDGQSTLVGNEGDNSITASKGSSSLWGSTGNDTLTGSNNYNEFFYLKGDGKDVIKCADSDDLINLYNITLEDISSANIRNMSVDIEFNDGGSLSIKTWDNLTFQLSDGSQWQSNHKTKSWTAK